MAQHDELGSAMASARRQLELLQRAAAWIERAGGAELLASGRIFRVIVQADGCEFMGDAGAPSLAVLRAYMAWRKSKGETIDLWAVEGA